MNIDAIWVLIQTALATWGLKIVAALAIFVFGRIIAGIVRRVTKKGLERAGFDVTLTPFMANLVYTVLMIGVLYGAASAVGIPMNGFVAIIGAAGLAVALAFQGTVKEIGIFTTTMATGDNVKITIPNSQIAGATIKNFSANENRRIDLVVGVSYDDDLNVAMDIMNRVIRADARVLGDPAPVVAVSEMGASSVDFVVRPWVKSGDYWAVKWDLTKALKEELEAGGCSIPYPQRDVHLFQQS